MSDYKKSLRFPTVPIDGRSLSIIMFSLFSSWLLAFPFEGQVLYAVTSQYNIDPHNIVFGAVAAHVIGLFGCGFLIKTMQTARRLIMFSIVICIAGTSLFFFSPTIIWNISIYMMSFLAGACVAAWGFYFRSFTPSNERIKTAASVLIYSNILMILLNMVAIHLLPSAGLAMSILMLLGALYFAIRLPEEDPTPTEPYDIEETTSQTSIFRPLAFLCLFVVIITFNSGLMYQVINPAFAHLEWLVSWYWALPYIVALYIMKNLPSKINRAYILYVGIAMIGLAFIAFMTFDRSATSYLVVDTLMLGACGIYDLFWWSILGEMLDLDSNPARILGIGLSANVLGVLLGGVLGSTVMASNNRVANPAVLALTVVFVILIILPLLHRRLSMLLKNHVYLVEFSAMTPEKQSETVMSVAPIGMLTERESEIAGLLLKGRTYKMIASELLLSENTVKTHIKNIYSKYEVNSKTELINLLMDKNALKKNS